MRMHGVRKIAFGVLSAMNCLVNETRHQMLLPGVFAVLLLGASGIALVMGWVPGTGNETTGNETGVDFTSLSFPVRAEDVTRVGDRCPECGIVESTRLIEPNVEGVDPDFSASVAMDRRKVKSTKRQRVAEVTVRLKNGKTHQFVDANPANWRSGDRVIFIEGQRDSSD